MTDPEQLHTDRVEQIARKVTEARERGEKPIIYHGQSHSARPDEFADDEKIHVEQLNHVLSIDEQNQSITVEPDVSMRELVDATLEHGMIPHVVPEFPEITVGGGIQGAAGESSCFRYGLFGKQATSFEIVTGDGEIVEATPDTNSDLFHGQFGAYGSLGILTSVTMDLLPAKQYVELTYHTVDGFDEAVQRLTELSNDGSIDYLDAIMFSEDHGVIMAGERTDEQNYPVRRFTRAQDEWFYLHVQQITQDTETVKETVPIKDYFFRYDIGSFWTLRGAFESSPIPFTRLTRTLFHPLMDTKTAYHAVIHEGNFSSQTLLQDIITPSEETAEFLDWITETLDVFPLWLLPMQPDAQSRLAPSYLDTDLAINVGIWGSPTTDIDVVEAKHKLEEQATAIGARKTLYAHQFHDEDTFWSIYDQDWYQEIRERYGADEAFPDVYENTITDELPAPSKTRAAKAFIRSLFDR